MNLSSIAIKSIVLALHELGKIYATDILKEQSMGLFLCLQALVKLLLSILWNFVYLSNYTVYFTLFLHV